jgi:hypothetical protein
MKTYNLLVYLKIHNLQEMLSKLYMLDMHAGKIKYRKFTSDEKKEFLKEFEGGVRQTEVSIKADCMENARRQVIESAQQFGTTVVKIETIDDENWYA